MSSHQQPDYRVHTNMQHYSGPVPPHGRVNTVLKHSAVNGRKPHQAGGDGCKPIDDQKDTRLRSRAAQGGGRGDGESQPQETGATRPPMLRGAAGSRGGGHPPPLPQRVLAVRGHGSSPAGSAQGHRRGARSRDLPQPQASTDCTKRHQALPNHRLNDWIRKRRWRICRPARRSWITKRHKWGLRHPACRFSVHLFAN